MVDPVVVAVRATDVEPLAGALAGAAPVEGGVRDPHVVRRLQLEQGARAAPERQAGDDDVRAGLDHERGARSDHRLARVRRADDHGCLGRGTHPAHGEVAVVGAVGQDEGGAAADRPERVGERAGVRDVDGARGRRDRVVVAVEEGVVERAGRGTGGCAGGVDSRGPAAGVPVGAGVRGSRTAVPIPAAASTATAAKARV